MNIAIIIISAFTLLITSWVLYESRKTRRLAEAQIRLANEPDFEFAITTPKRDPVSIACRNWGARVKDLNIILKDREEFLAPHPSQCFDEYFIEIPRYLFDGKEELDFDIIYCDKLKRMNRKCYIINIKNNIIISK